MIKHVKMIIFEQLVELKGVSATTYPKMIKFPQMIIFGEEMIIFGAWSWL
jgi:hypothetical protein